MMSTLPQPPKSTPGLHVSSKLQNVRQIKHVKGGLSSRETQMSIRKHRRPEAVGEDLDSKADLKIQAKRTKGFY